MYLDIIITATERCQSKFLFLATPETYLRRIRNMPIKYSVVFPLLYFSEQYKSTIHNPTIQPRTTEAQQPPQRRYHAIVRLCELLFNKCHATASAIGFHFIFHLHALHKNQVRPKYMPVSICRPFKEVAWSAVIMTVRSGCVALESFPY